MSALFDHISVPLGLVSDTMSDSITPEYVFVRIQTFILWPGVW